MSAHDKAGFEGKRGIYVEVKNNNMDGAIRLLNRKVKQEGIIKEIRRRRAFEKPSEARRRKASEALKRAAKNRQEE